MIVVRERCVCVRGGMLKHFGGEVSGHLQFCFQNHLTKCNEHWVLYGTDESLGSTPETSNILYVN